MTYHRVCGKAKIRLCQSQNAVMCKFKGHCNILRLKFQPFENLDQLLELTDSRTGARYCECHIKGSTIVSLGTIDVPLDPEEQPDYRANRDIVVNNAAFQAMIKDAKQRPEQKLRAGG